MMTRSEFGHTARMRKIYSRTALLVLNYALLCFLFSCSAQKQAAKKSAKSPINIAAAKIINSKELQTAHVGIAVFDPAANKFLYNHDGDKYFIPASNTKIITCYADMKYLGDSLEGLKIIDADTVIIFPTGDPSFLHKDFSRQPVSDFLSTIHKPVLIIDNMWNENALGFGWAWDDYNDDYMPERSAFPVYGNEYSLAGKSNSLFIHPTAVTTIVADNGGYLSKAVRTKEGNYFSLYFNGSKPDTINVPFATMNGELNKQIIADKFHLNVVPAGSRKNFFPDKSMHVIYSQPTDSLLKIMMHRSDNFYAEQSLLMVSNKLLGTMNDAKIIDTLLKSDLKDFPQKPRWVDGSGLSRYNLFTPQDFVFVLNKMRNEFSWNRITTIFAAGGNGTLGSSFAKLGNNIYAKTGSLSNNATLSGYLITAKGKTLIFSIMVGNYIASSSAIRNMVADFLGEVADTY